MNKEIISKKENGDDQNFLPIYRMKQDIQKLKKNDTDRSWRKNVITNVIIEK